MGKGENAGYQHFLLFPWMFSKGLFVWVVKSQDCVVKGLTPISYSMTHNDFR